MAINGEKHFTSLLHYNGEKICSQSAYSAYFPRFLYNRLKRLPRLLLWYGEGTYKQTMIVCFTCRSESFLLTKRAVKRLAMLEQPNPLGWLPSPYGCSTLPAMQGVVLCLFRLKLQKRVLSSYSWEHKSIDKWMIHYHVRLALKLEHAIISSIIFKRFKSL